MAAANNDTKTPLLSSESTATRPREEDRTTALTRRMYQRWKSAPAKRHHQQTLNISEDHSTPPAEPNLADKPALLRAFLILIVYLGIGTACFSLVSDELKGSGTNRFVDAIYFCIVTMTTVGYGDLVPGSALTKFLACAYVFCGMAIVGIILSKVADYFVEKQEVLLARAVHLRDMASPNEVVKEVAGNKTKYKLMMSSTLLVVLVTSGTTFLTLVEKMRLIDAFYCVCVTITTLGYGDKSFSTMGGRIFAVFWILSSTICLAQFYFYLTELYTESRQKLLIEWVLSRKLTFADIEAADIDNDLVVSASEFILFKLKEMGKINEEDISMLMECFRNLDVSQSGTLTAVDVVLATS